MSMLSIRIAQFIASIMGKFGYVHMDRVSEIVGENAVANYKAGWNDGYDQGFTSGYDSGYEAAVFDREVHDEQMAAWNELLEALDN